MGPQFCRTTPQPVKVVPCSGYPTMTNHFTLISCPRNTNHNQCSLQDLDHLNIMRKHAAWKAKPIKKLLTELNKSKWLKKELGELQIAQDLSFLHLTRNKYGKERHNYNWFGFRVFMTQEGYNHYSLIILIRKYTNSKHLPQISMYCAFSDECFSPHHGCEEWFTIDFLSAWISLATLLWPLLSVRCFHTQN